MKTIRNKILLILVLFFISISICTVKSLAVTYITRIDINDFVCDVNDEMTGNMAKANIAFEFPSTASYGRGNDNKYFHQNGSTITTQKFTQGAADVVIECYAKKVGLNVENPEYDFDKDNLGNIAVYINGVRRTDVTIYGYNSSWRCVDIKIPITVSHYTGTKYTVTFNSNGGSSVPNQSVAAGYYAVEPEKPTRSGKVFLGWFKDAALTTHFIFNTTKIEGPTTIYAKWRDEVVTQNITKIYIENFYPVITNNMTGNEAKNYISNYNYSDSCNCGKGNDNVYVYQNNSRVTTGTLTAGATSYFKLECYAKTVGLNVENPEYDFDKDNLDKIEVYVNGSRRKDAVVYDYNPSWRSIDIKLPFTVYPASQVATVKFESNGGKTIKDQNVLKGQKLIQPNEPTKSGYKFDWWYTNSGLTNPYNFSSTVNNDFTLYAKWKKIYYVTLNLNGGTNNGAELTSELVEGDVISFYYDFINFINNNIIPPDGNVLDAVEIDGVRYELGSSYTLTKSITLKLLWKSNKPPTYLVKFDTDGGSNIVDQYIEEGGKASKPFFDPGKRGCIFDGWYTSKSYTTLYDFNTPIYQDTIIYAKWIELDVTILNEIRFTSSVTRVQPGTMPAFDLTNETEHITIESYDNIGNTKWVRNKLGSNWQNNFEVFSPQVAEVGDYHYFFRLRVKLETGYDFHDDVRIYFNGKEITNDPYTYMNQYSWGCYLYVYIGKATNNNLVVFDSNGGTEIENQEVAPGGKVTKPSDPTRTGCEFYGWFTDEALTQEFNFNTTVNSDLTLYAKYKGTVVARSYNNTTNSVFSGGYVGLGTHEPNNNYDEASVFCDDYIDLKANVNTGYNFIGWYENSPTGKLLSNNLTYNYKVLKDTDVYAVFEEKTLPTIEYSVQIKNEGWHAAVKNGETAMRNVSGNLQQAMRINIPDKPYEGSVEYRVHIENVGWQDWKKDGEIAGIEGTSLRTEALQIKLTGEMADHYDVYYRTHVQNNGWMSWAKNGEASGSSGAGLRIEGIQIKLTKKDAGEPAYNEYEPDKSYPFHEQVNVIYMGHIENKGDVGTNYLIRNGKTLGFPGQHLRMEGIKIYSESTTPGTIEYTTHVQNVGWLDEVDGAWSKSGEFCGRKGLGLRLEAIRIRLTDELADKYSVYYHVYSEKDGKWLDWAKDGDPAGSVGFSSKLEAIEIKVLVHGDPHEPTVGPNALVEAP